MSKKTCSTFFFVKRMRNSLKFCPNLWYTNAMKIWIKLQTADKTLAHTTVELAENPSEQEFLVALRLGAQRLDCPTPVLLTAHFERFLQFGIVRFREDDFVEVVNFGKMEIEWLKEKKPKR